MNRKTIFCFLTALIMIFVLAGCGGKDSSKSADSKDSAATFEEKKEDGRESINVELMARLSQME